MEKQTTQAKLNLQLKQLEVEEKKKELFNVDKRLENAKKGLIVDQVNTLLRLLEATVVGKNDFDNSTYVSAFDTDDQIVIKAKIMRLINTF